MTSEPFTRLLTALRPRMLASAKRMVGPEDAPDVIQEVFLRLWQHRSQLLEADNPEGMATRSLRNACVDLLRRRATHPEVEIDESTARDSVDDAATIREETEQRMADVNLIISQVLSERDRRILLMRDRDGMEFEDIALRTGLTEGNLRMIVSRSRRAVREAYRKYINQ